MATQFSTSDSDVVVIIGSGAGGGTLGNELAQRGVKVVMLEAGKHYTQADFENDEWAMFNKISWLDKRDRHQMARFWPRAAAKLPADPAEPLPGEGAAAAPR